MSDLLKWTEFSSEKDIGFTFHARRVKNGKKVQLLFLEKENTSRWCWSYNPKTPKERPGGTQSKWKAKESAWNFGNSCLSIHEPAVEQLLAVFSEALRHVSEPHHFHARRRRHSDRVLHHRLEEDLLAGVPEQVRQTPALHLHELLLSSPYLTSPLPMIDWNSSEKLS